MHDFGLRLGGKRMLLIFFLLLSLCSSRAEGLHLLPFADRTDADKTSSLAATGDDLPYQLSRIPEEDSSRPSLTLKQVQQHNGFAFSIFTVALTPRFTGVYPKHSIWDESSLARWRHLRTSLSDRSPPLF